VRARPPSQIYRLQKLARRNKVVFISGAAVSLTLILGLGTSTWLYLKERQAWHEQARLLAQAEIAKNHEAALRQQAEDSERITQAAILVSKGKLEEADHLLDDVNNLIRPSLDGVTAYRKVAEWLALQGLWAKAGERFSKLIKIDELDKWTVVSWDYQYCGTVLAESGDLKTHTRFCQASITHFYASTNGNEAWRILRTCLLVPVDKNLLASLRPLAALSENAYKNWPEDPTNLLWGAIPVSLWKYRNGDYQAAEQCCRRALASPDQLDARKANLHMILAMSCFKLARPQEARIELNRGQALVEKRFPHGRFQANSNQGFWWDWVDASILMREATTTVDDNLAPAESDGSPDLSQ
jgi:tetratricopeptide (TPR) repeat protein